ncbi:hypothetical protein Tco_0164049 [Tanacetum coccineum]|uniref:Uncharacterized protein n=1 Tax=Tanacetum coccineum TaxID=301880 RepID=A0ABQ5ECC0_9ASTR
MVVLGIHGSMLSSSLSAINCVSDSLNVIDQEDIYLTTRGTTFGTSFELDGSLLWSEFRVPEGLAKSFDEERED